jgi:hypothetical protein
MIEQIASLRSPCAAARPLARDTIFSDMTRSILRAAARLTLVWCAVGLPAAAQTIPAGWRGVPAVAVGVERAFEATSLPVGEFLRVEQSPLRPLSGASIDAWLTAAVEGDAAPVGRWVTAASRPSNVTAGLMATVAREFQQPNSARGGRIYLGVAGGTGEARVVRLTFSSAAALQSPQGAAAREFMSELARQSLESRGRTVATGGTAPSARASAGASPSRTGFRPGGPIVPGRYVGDMVNDEGQTVVQYDVTLFANGEYAAPLGDNRLDSTGTYAYVSATGRIDIDGKLYNNSYRPDEDFALFGRDASGVPAIYAEDYYGIGTFRALLRRVSDPTREPPSVVLAARKAAEAEAARYTFVTAPGNGVQDAQIEAVYYAWRQELEIGGLQLKEEVYLLLRDGSVHRGLPVPPQDLDVAASRRGEPERWGRWRRAGAQYEFAFDGAFKRQQGHPVLPARGVALQGRFEGSSHYQIPGGAGAWSQFGVTFSGGSRFELFRTGGAGMTGGVGDMAVTTAVVYDDDGTVAGVTGSTAAGGSTRRTPDTGNRRGTYRVDGHAIILTYENGRVERLPFVIEPDARGGAKGVWMLGSLLAPPKP